MAKNWKNNKNNNNNNKNNKNNNNYSKKNKDQYKNEYKLIDQLMRQIDKKEEEIARLQSEALEKGNYRPNMFIFNDNPEDTPLLDEKEKHDLMANKDKMQQELLNLNPYNEKEYDDLMRIQAEMDQAKENKEKSHPLDFVEEPEPQHSNTEKWQNDSSAEEPREEYYEKKRLERSPWGNTRQSPWER